MSSGPVFTADAGHGGAAAAMRLLARETRVSPGRVPRELGGMPIAADTSRLHGDSYVLRTDTGLGFFYRRGEGITVEHDAGADFSEESLWLNGSVYAAIACINGLLPIHASAVVCAGRVHAFTGPSGSGKSTLVAALAGHGPHGLTMYADDTLVLDLSDPARVICLPGHKRLKLTAEAIALTAAQAQESVGVLSGKFYARPAGAIPVQASQPLPLAELIFLESGDTLAMTPITGAARMARLDDDHYTTELFMRAHSRGRAEIFAVRARLARQVAMSCLVRPRDLARFADSVELAARHVHQEVHPA